MTAIAIIAAVRGKLTIDRSGEVVQKILFIYTVFAYNDVAVHSVRYGAVICGAKQVLAETGGAVSALTPREHTVLRQQKLLATGNGKVRQRRAP